MRRYRMEGAITPQAIFSPELPEGWVVKSSGDRWIITVYSRSAGCGNRSVGHRTGLPAGMEKSGCILSAGLVY